MEYTKISKKMKSPVDGLELDLLILVPEEAPERNPADSSRYGRV